MIYLISDTHFNHKNIILYENRPFQSVEQMNEYMIAKWNATISKQDVVYHLGDFGWGNKEEISKIIERLNGYKILIKGNHDKKSKIWFHDAGFNDVIDGGVILDNFYLLSHKPLYVNDNMPYINIHGHIHSQNMEGYQYFNVSVEQLNYEPILFETIKRGYDEMS